MSEWFFEREQTIQYNNIKILYSIVNNNHIESRKNIPSMKANLKHNYYIK